MLIVATGSTLTDLVFGSNDTLYVADPAAGEIDTVTPGGVVANFAMGLGFPGGLALDELGGSILVADSGTDMLRTVTIAGAVVSDLAAFDFDSGGAPSGIAYDGRGNVLVQTGGGDATVEVFTLPVP